MVMTTLAAYLEGRCVLGVSVRRPKGQHPLLRMVNMFLRGFVTAQDVGFRHSGLYWFVRLASLWAQECVQSPTDRMSNITRSSRIELTSVAS